MIDATATAIASSLNVIAATLGTSLALISVVTKTWHKQLGERFDSFFGVQIEVWLRRRLGSTAACGSPLIELTVCMHVIAEPVGWPAPPEGIDRGAGLADAHGSEHPVDQRKRQRRQRRRGRQRPHGEHFELCNQELNAHAAVGYACLGPALKVFLCLAFGGQRFTYQCCLSQQGTGRAL